MYTLSQLGWNPACEAACGRFDRTSHVPARVCAEHKNIYRLIGESGEWLAEVSGRLRHAEQFPAVGDWVVATERGGSDRDATRWATIEHVLPRHSHFSRQAAGRATRPQVVAANVDLVFILQGLDGDFNPRRLERTLLMIWEGGAAPVVVFNKSDACDDLESRLCDARDVVGGVPTYAVSALHGDGLAPLHACLQEGRTVAVVGSSGAGKSTLINRFLGHETLRTGAVRPTDDHGRHTTTHRQLLVLPDHNGLIVDTPGMREIQLLDGPIGDALDRTFGDVAAVAAGCRFRDCKHDAEPGCAVRKAIGDGLLNAARLTALDKLRREQRHAAMRTDERLRIEEHKRVKALHRQFRQRPHR